MGKGLREERRVPFSVLARHLNKVGLIPQEVLSHMLDPPRDILLVLEIFHCELLVGLPKNKERIKLLMLFFLSLYLLIYYIYCCKSESKLQGRADRQCVQLGALALKVRR